MLVPLWGCAGSCWHVLTRVLTPAPGQGCHHCPLTTGYKHGLLKSEGHMAWIGQIRLVLQWLLGTKATTMGDQSKSSAWCEETPPKSHPTASSWVFHCSTSSPFSGWS